MFESNFLEVIAAEDELLQMAKVIAGEDEHI